MARRSRAREVAFQVLYQDDLNPRNNPAVGDQLIAQRLRADDLIGFARGLVAGVRQHREEVDRVLQATAANWSLKRMAATDRNVLRLAAYEILHGDTPGRVAIDEAVELAKRFGSAQSAQFVNGILDKVMHGKEASTESNSPEPPPPDVGVAVVPDVGVAVVPDVGVAVVPDVGVAVVLDVGVAVVPDVGVAVVLPPRGGSATAAPTEESSSSEPPGPEIP